MLEKIGSCPIKKGKLTRGFLKVDSKLKLPIAVMKGGKGKTCFISGGMHGNEINGPRLVELLMHSIDAQNLKGTIIFIPVLNVSGFNHKQRHVFEDDKDLNRCFPGNGNSTAYKIAKAVYDNVIKNVDFGIDCHDAGHTKVLIPQSRVHVNTKGVCNDGCTHEMGKSFGTKIVLQREGIKGMIAIETYRRLNKPVLTVEVGGGMVLWDDLLEEARQGINNVLIHMGMLDGNIVLPKEQFLISDLDRFTYRAKNEGLLYKKVTLGQEVHKGELIAVIHNPVDEKTEKVFSKHCGFVFSLKMQDKINPKEVILTILQSKNCRRHGTKESIYLKKI